MTTHCAWQIGALRVSIVAIALHCVPDWNAALSADLQFCIKNYIKVKHWRISGVRRPHPTLGWLLQTLICSDDYINGLTPLALREICSIHYKNRLGLRR
jgi:hypothetical protein